MFVVRLQRCDPTRGFWMECEVPKNRIGRCVSLRKKGGREWGGGGMWGFETERGVSEGGRGGSLNRLKGPKSKVRRMVQKGGQRTAGRA